jgi:hypothetical protein
MDLKEAYVLKKSACPESPDKRAVFAFGFDIELREQLTCYAFNNATYNSRMHSVGMRKSRA